MRDGDITIHWDIRTITTKQDARSRPLEQGKQVVTEWSRRVSSIATWNRGEWWLNLFSDSFRTWPRAFWQQHILYTKMYGRQQIHLVKMQSCLFWQERYNFWNSRRFSQCMQPLRSMKGMILCHPGSLHFLYQQKLECFSTVMDQSLLQAKSIPLH